VVAHFRCTGTQGAWQGLPPTGRTMLVDEVYFFRVKADRLHRVWGLEDTWTRYRQLQGDATRPGRHGSLDQPPRGWLERSERRARQQGRSFAVVLDLLIASGDETAGTVVPEDRTNDRRVVSCIQRITLRSRLPHNLQETRFGRRISRAYFLAAGRGFESYRGHSRLPRPWSRVASAGVIGVGAIRCS
jgi:hypothetical protein